MKVTDHIKAANGKTFFSIEILPPLKGQDINHIFNAIEPLMEFKPPFIDVTYHREDYVYKENALGIKEKKIITKRPGTIGISAAIMNRFKVDAVPHLICGSFTKQETEDALIDLAFLGIDNVLALRGDPIKAEGTFIPKEGGNAYASELVQQINHMNKGIYLDEELKNPFSTDFCVGVAAYPEMHMDAPNMETDLKHLQHKINVGSDYIVTQMFFDNEKYKSFVKTIQQMGIDIPVIPGLKPITTKKQLEILPKVFHLEIPEALRIEVDKCTTDEQVKQVGIEWAIEQSKDLRSFGVPVLHYYTMSKSDAIYQIASKLF
jgi:methylenetetrahydrofolate reductase (NADPH)